MFFLSYVFTKNKLILLAYFSTQIVVVIRCSSDIEEIGWIWVYITINKEIKYLIIKCKDKE